MDSLQGVNFLYPYLNINDSRQLAKELYRLLKDQLRRLYAPADKPRRAGGTDCLRSWMADIRREGESAVAWAKSAGPHHDPCRATVSHRPGDRARHRSAGDISRLCRRDRGQHHRTDSTRARPCAEPVDVPFRRLYAAARYAVAHPDVQLVQLVSFGCGLDAITTDEVREILERGDKLYTQIKIDEIPIWAP